MKILVVEDRATFAPELGRRLINCGGEPKWRAHPAALQLSPEEWAEWPLVLLDAWDLSSQQDDHTRSRLAALDVLEQLGRLTGGARPRVVVYSTHMSRPEVHLPFRSSPHVSALFPLETLLRHLDEVVAGEVRHQLPAPSESDWRALHPKLAAGADVALIHRRMRSHDAAWRQVWLDDARFDRAAMMWIRRNVQELVGPDAGYRVAVEVTRKVAGLPYRVGP